MLRTLKVEINGTIVHSEQVTDWKVMMQAQHLKRIFPVDEMCMNDTDAGVYVYISSKMNNKSFVPDTEDWDNKIEKLYSNREVEF